MGLPTLGKIVSWLCFINTMIARCHATPHIEGLSYFEIVKEMRLETRIRRSATNEKQKHKFVSFKAYNRSFNVILKPGTDVLTKDFQAMVINGNGRSSRFHVDVNQMFSGHLTDKPSVSVIGHMEDTMITLTIFDTDDTFALEPARTFMKDDGQSWIVYRYFDTEDPVRSWEPDITKNSSSFCGIQLENGINETVQANSNLKSRPGNDRMKRDMSEKKNTCTIHVVASYDLLKQRCYMSVYICAQIMINSVRYGDYIYRKTDFGYFSGLRLQIHKMTILTSPTSMKDRSPNYQFNIEKTWKHETLLQAFKNFAYGPMEFKDRIRLNDSKADGDSCIAFLFSAHQTESPILGLAYVGSACRYYGSGFGILVSDSRVPITSLRRNMLFTHEVGHTFGSPHDSETKECSYSSNGGGHYLMWPYISENHCTNCQKFSICSRKSIASYLSSRKSRKCFVEYSKSNGFCGNGLVDKDEECDEALIPLRKISCCNSTCNFVKGAQCSDLNSACCKQCDLAPAGLLCIGHIEGTCLGESTCSGKSLDCPVAPPLPDHTPCRDNGKCFNGKCMDFCYVEGVKTNKTLKPCLCKDSDSGCKLCCYEYSSDKSVKGNCRPYSNVSLKDYRPCYIGYCLNGVCTRTHPKTLTVMKLLSGIDRDSVGEFFRTNIVPAVLLMSLILWLPISLYISFIDRKIQVQVERLDAILESVPKASLVRFEESNRFTLTPTELPLSLRRTGMERESQQRISV